MSAKKSKPYLCGTQLIYCKFGNIRENFIFANSVKRHICDVKMRLEHDLPRSVNDRVVCVFFARILFSRNFAYAVSALVYIELFLF